MIVREPVLLEPVAPAAAAGERAARAALRGQIAKLERDVAHAHLAVRPPIPFEAVTGSLAGPRLLGLGDLERIRDALAGHLQAVRERAGAQAGRQEAARELLEDMLARPADHKWVRLRVDDFGGDGCVSYHVRPRLGLIGMLMGWWRVKISSGCPLASAADGPPQPQAPPGA